MILRTVAKMTKRLESDQYNPKTDKSGSKQITHERMQNGLKKMLLNTRRLESSTTKIWQMINELSDEL